MCCQCMYVYKLLVYSTNVVCIRKRRIVRIQTHQSARIHTFAKHITMFVYVQICVSTNCLYTVTHVACIRTRIQTHQSARIHAFAKHITMFVYVLKCVSTNCLYTVTHVVCIRASRHSVDTQKNMFTILEQFVYTL